MPDTDQMMISNAEMATLCRQFATLMAAQVNILDIFEALREGTENRFLREVLFSVQDAVEMGRSLATAFSHYPQAFSPFFISMLRQGELEGELDRVLEELALHYETRLTTEVEVTRRPEAGATDLQTVASLFHWAFIWIVGLISAAFLGSGVVYWATADGALPGHPVANVMLLVGLVLLLGVVVFAWGRRKSRVL